MDINNVRERLLGLKETMEVERDEMMETRLRMEAREAQLQALDNEKQTVVDVQDKIIEQKKKENNDQEDMLEQLIKVRDELMKEVAELCARPSNSAPNKRSHDEDDSESTSEKKQRTAGDGEEDYQEGTSSTVVQDNVSGPSTEATLEDAKQADTEEQKNN
ncbi:unnamed protein product [Caenorhabditis brenneri]